MYDGMRQFLFILPPLAVLAGAAFASFLKSGAHGFIKLSVTALILLPACLTIWDMVQLHPYQYVYFNRMVAGGTRAASENFETDYWGAAYKEGVEWVINHAPTHPAQKIRVANCEQSFLISYFLERTEDLRRRFVVVKPDEKPDIYLGITRWRCDRAMEGRVIYTVQRKGTPLLFVFEVQGRHRPEALKKCADFTTLCE